MQKKETAVNSMKKLLCKTQMKAIKGGIWCPNGLGGQYWFNGTVCPPSGGGSSSKKGGGIVVNGGGGFGSPFGR